MAGEPGDLFDIGRLGSLGEIADPHVLDHAKAKWRSEVITKLLPSTKAADEALCSLIECLLGSLGGFLTQHNVDPKAVQSCVEAWCKVRLAGPTAKELAEREGTAQPYP
jgi:hypothetical protein